MTNDGGDEGVNEIVRFHLDEFGDLDCGREAEGEKVGSDEVDDLFGKRERERRVESANERTNKRATSVLFFIHQHQKQLDKR